MRVGFEPTPFRTSALSWRLRPLGHLTFLVLVLHCIPHLMGAPRYLQKSDQISIIKRGEIWVKNRRRLFDDDYFSHKIIIMIKTFSQEFLIYCYLRISYNLYFKEKSMDPVRDNFLKSLSNYSECIRPYLRQI